MEFRTIVKLPPSSIFLRPRDRVLLLGSCFAEHIGQKMLESRMRAMVNPTGVLYNPESIRFCLDMLLTGAYDEARFLFKDSAGMWHSWLHNSRFDNASPGAALHVIQTALAEGQKQLLNADILIVTFGTNHVYRHKALNHIVANCHHAPASTFAEETLSVAEIVASWQDLLQRLPERTKVVFTVSPYRYAKYGFHGNQLSKATLFLAIDELCRRNARCTYFPAYEIVLDELRDYRFFAPDMLHVSQQAVDYVWERFCTWIFSPEMATFAEEWTEISKALKHRPLHPESEAFRRFEADTKERLKQFEERWGIKP